MTIQEALALQVGDVIVRNETEDVFPGSGCVRVMLCTKARPEVGFAPSVSGVDVKFDNVKFYVIIDGGSECMSALRYWRKA